MTQIIVDMQFLAEQFKWGVDDFNKLKWRMRKELIEFQMNCIEERNKKQGK